MGLRVDIYRTASYDSDRNLFYGKNEVTVINVEGPFEPTDDAPAALLTVRYGNPIIVADVPATDKVGPMMGGTYAATSDSRFNQASGTYAAIPIHDRYESWPEYEVLSR